MVIGAVAAALAGAALFALAAVLQQEEALRASTATLLDTRLLWRLLHRPRWVIGIAADVVSAGLHVLALGLGPVTLVQPLGITGLVFAVPLGAVVHHRRSRPVDVVAAVAVLAGLAMVLYLLTPSTDTGGTTTSAVLTVGGVAVAVTVLTLGASTIAALPGRLRGAFLASGAGAAFGVTAVLISAILSLLGRPHSGVLIGWASLAVVLLIPLGYLALQNAYRAGHFGSSLALAVVVDPLVAVFAAAYLLSQPLPTAAGRLTFLVISAAVVIAGLGVLVGSPAQANPIPADPESANCQHDEGSGARDQAVDGERNQGAGPEVPLEESHGQVGADE